MLTKVKSVKTSTIFICSCSNRGRFSPGCTTRFKEEGFFSFWRFDLKCRRYLTYHPLCQLPAFIQHLELTEPVSCIFISPTTAIYEVNSSEIQEEQIIQGHRRMLATSAHKLYYHWTQSTIQNIPTKYNSIKEKPYFLISGMHICLRFR